jgi:hypothetical protein
MDVEPPTHAMRLAGSVRKVGGILSALSDYVREVKRQAGLLEDANTFDDACLSEQPPNFGRRKGRRHWTRQDRHRFHYEVACDEWNGTGEPPSPPGRADTRVWRILRRLPDIEIAHKLALADAEQRGIYDRLAPLLVELTESHQDLLALYAGESYRMQRELDWSATSQRHSDALHNLDRYTPSDEQRRQSSAERQHARESFRRTIAKFFAPVETPPGSPRPAPRGNIEQHNESARRDADAKRALFVAALLTHHGYKNGGSIGNYEPISFKSSHFGRLKGASLTRQFKAFGSYKGYKAACKNGQLEAYLRGFAGDEITHVARQGLAEQIAENNSRH